MGPITTRNKMMEWFAVSRPKWTVDKLRGDVVLVQGVPFSLRLSHDLNVRDSNLANICNELFPPNLFDYQQWGWQEAQPNIFLNMRRKRQGRISTDGRSDIIEVLSPNLALGYWLRVEQPQVGYFVSVSINMMVGWGQTPDTLKKQALENLSRRTAEMGVTIKQVGVIQKGFTFRFTSEDPLHNPARLLLPEVRRELVGHLGPVFYVAMPTDHSVMAFNGDKLLRHARGLTPDPKDLGECENIITNDILISSPDGLSLVPNPNKKQHKQNKPRSIEDVQKRIDQQLRVISGAKRKLTGLQKAKDRFEREQSKNAAIKTSKPTNQSIAVSVGVDTAPSYLTTLFCRHHGR